MMFPICRGCCVQQANPARWVPRGAVLRLLLGALVLWVLPLPVARSADTVSQPQQKLLMVIAEKEYETRQTLPAFAETHLGKRFAIDYVTAPDEEGRHDLAGLERAEDYDLVLLSVRRRAPKEAQLAALRRYVDAGGAVVVIRTSCHAFSLRGDPPPQGHAVWEGFDVDVLGCHYANHHPNGVVTEVRAEPGVSDDQALLSGVRLPFLSGGSLYLVRPLTARTKPLLVGAIPGKPAEPVAWTATSPGGGRVFATTLGHVSDFEGEAFPRLLANGIAWASGTPP